MNEAGTWHGGKPQPRRLCVRWGPSSLTPKRGGAPSQFSAHFCCGQTALCIKMPLAMDVGLSPGDFVLDGDPVFPPQQRTQSPLAIFGPFLLCPNGWMHQAATRYEGRPQPRRVCVRWGDPAPSTKGGGVPSPILGVEVRISKFDRKCGALPVVAKFVALEQQIILVTTRSESV